MTLGFSHCLITVYRATTPISHYAIRQKVDADYAITPPLVLMKRPADTGARWGVVAIAGHC